jgi:hypothetical protein
LIDETKLGQWFRYHQAEKWSSANGCSITSPDIKVSIRDTKLDLSRIKPALWCWLSSNLFSRG